MFSLSYTNTSFKLKYVLYKTNKLIMIYSYVITSLPEEVQVYNNTTTFFFYSSSLFCWLVGARGTYCSLLLTSRSSLGDFCTVRAEEDGPTDAWLVMTTGFVGWLTTDGISSWLVDGVPYTGVVPPPHRLMSPIIFEDRSSWVIRSSSALSGLTSFGYLASRRLRSIRG